MANERKHSDPITYEIAEHLAVISVKEDGWSKELNLVSWNGQQPPKFDIREWAPDHTRMTKGVTLFDHEMKRVCHAYMKFCNARTVSESRNNRNAAAEAGMRAGQEAARAQEEADMEAKVQPAAEVKAPAAQDASYQEDDFDMPDAGVPGVSAPEENEEEYASLNDETVPVDLAASAESGAAEAQAAV